MHQLQRRDYVESNETIDVRIGYIGGGSQGWAHTLINDLAQCTDISGTVALYDVDYESASMNAELGNSVIRQEGASGDWTFEAFRTLEATLDSADFVISSIQDPPEETFVHDIDVPAKYGIYQTVADTVGPGGMFRSLRAIPQYRQIAAAVREHCPNAWVINYTNPMTMCTRTLYEEYPDINAIGLCHEVFGTQRLLAEITEKYIEGATDVSAEEIDVNVKGINHFTWVDEAHWRGHDVFQYLDTELESRKPLANNDPGDFDGDSYWINNHQIAFDLYDTFGLLGAAGDRHLAEFVPWYLDINDPSEIQRWGIRLTPSSARVSDSEGPAKMERYLNGDEEFEFKQSGEEAVDIMRALLGLGPLKTHVNYPNVGQTPELTDGAVVETNALITGDQVAPVTAGPLPSEIQSIVQTHVTNQETLIKAGFSGDLDLAFQAFCNDPLVTVQPDDARALFSDLVELERDYLTDYNVDGAAVLSN